MPVHIDVRVVELLTSRLCHDLIGPISAVNNGMELLAESPDDRETVDDAVNLAGRSAGQAAGLLQFYRAAHGRAGRRTETGGEEVYDLARGYAKARKTDLDWPEDERWAEVSADYAKLALNLVALAVEALPRNGTVTLLLNDAALPAVLADGTGARLDPNTAAALTTDIDPDTLTPHTVQAHFTALLAAAQGCHVVTALPAEGQVRLDLQAGQG
jgi:histidine phosphotransferase ChpT